ncbi:MAG: hypothetical protein WBF73_19020 [Bradyrhizobium sp.]
MTSPIIVASLKHRGILLEVSRSPAARPGQADGDLPICVADLRRSPDRASFAKLAFDVRHHYGECVLDRCKRRRLAEDLGVDR